MCQIETHYYQQREAMNTILPVGNRQISTMRTMLTRDIAALLPFNVQELNEKSGVCYGINRFLITFALETGKNWQMEMEWYSVSPAPENPISVSRKCCRCS